MFDWYQYLELASELSKNDIILPSNEACLRSSISRAYYAAFHEAKKYVKKKYLAKYNQYSIPRTRDYRPSHLRVHDILDETNDSTLMLIASNLETIKKNRIDADYESSKNINTNKVIFVFVTAYDLIEEIKKLP